jgi:hypothetical protein
MKITVERREKANTFTISRLSVDDGWGCWVLEDPVREREGVPVEQWKVKGETAIPAGIYQVVITPSQRFGRDLPLLVDVPGFSGIRIHPGNSAADTEGCLLVGLARGVDSISHSRDAFNELFPLIEEALNRGDAVTLEIA